MEMPGMETRRRKSRVPPRQGAATKGGSTGSAKRKREAKEVPLDLLEDERNSTLDDEGMNVKSSTVRNPNGHTHEDEAQPESNDATSKETKDSCEILDMNDEAVATAKVKKKESTKKGMTALRAANMTIEQKVQVLKCVSESFPSTHKQLTVSHRKVLREHVNAMMRRKVTLFPKVSKRVGGQNKEYQVNVSYDDFNSYLQEILNFRTAGTIVDQYKLSGVGGPEGNLFQTERDLKVAIWEKNNANVGKGEADKKFKAVERQERKERMQLVAAGINNNFFHGRQGKTNIKGEDGNAHRQGEASGSHGTYTGAEDPPGDFEHIQEGEGRGNLPASQPLSIAEALVKMSTQLHDVAKIIMRIDDKLDRIDDKLNEEKN